jgi:amino acid transporter
MTMTIHSTHQTSSRVVESGKFKKQLTLTDLTFIGLGAIFGSGWLFAASHVASIAGPAGIASWVIGGIAVLLLGIVYCELGRRCRAPGDYPLSGVFPRRADGVSAGLYYADCVLQPDLH